MEIRAISAGALEFVAALRAAQLPTEDLADGSRTFFAVAEAGQTVGFGGFELYGDDVLLRSVVVVEGLRGRGYGRTVSELILARAHDAGARRAYLLTTTAEGFFKHEGFVPIERADAPASILGTTQATTICSTAALLTRSLRADG